MMKLTHTILIFFVLIGASDSFAKCLTRHIDEALELNHHRKVPYSLLSQKRSEPISDALIQMENKMRSQTKWADFYALYWRVHGIGLLCDEVVEMSLTPAFQSHFNDLSPLKTLTITPHEWQNKIKMYLLKKDFVGLEKWSHKLVLALEVEPRTYCLTRHFVESIRRAAGLAPLHEKQAKELQISSTSWVSRQYISKQARLLNETVRIDLMAYPLQSEGLPIICQDVPYIPRVLNFGPHDKVDHIFR